jgi:predicted nucleic acid-binding protein
MTYLVDTHWVASFLRGRREAEALFRSITFEEAAISLISYGEIFEGIYYGTDPAGDEALFRQFLRGITVLPLNRPIMQRFARIRGDLRRRGELIGDPDILIAATALHHNLTLVTRNVRHFERIAGLSLYQ